LIVRRNMIAAHWSGASRALQAPEQYQIAQRKGNN
jgi:hypothetical protein